MTKHNISITATYYHTTNTIHLNAESTQIYPTYLKYLLKHLKVPKNASIAFKDKTFKGGIEEILNKKEKHYG